MFKTIGIGIAFSPNLRANIYEAIRFSQYFKSKLVLIHVGSKTEEKLNKIEASINEAQGNSLNIETVFSEGEPVEVILSITKEKKIELLLIGALQREKLVTYYMGSIARKISRKASCSIMLLTHPSVKPTPYNHFVVNGLKDPKTFKTINSAFYTASKIGGKKITIVEEITQTELAVKVKDDKSLRKSQLMKEKIKRREGIRVKELLNKIPLELKDNVNIKIQGIFGKRGYSIGHYAELVRADLLVMNAPIKSGLWDRIFPHDIEYILTELPSDVLIIR
ncbi:Nucleotide-binding universal stress protein, UspA family [Flavobacteriaceae bacterium MAR_2010_188]|nr:Nucleotide-binding universal stress protein, UspA family [Flavobacteriaceae bacterium MAR_2010_188]